MNKKNPRRIYLMIEWAIVIAVLLLVIVIVKYFKNYEAPFQEENKEEGLLIYTQYDSYKLLENLQKVADVYSELEGNPKVIIKNIPEENFQKELCIARDKNKLPDLIIYDTSLTSSLVSMKVLQDLSEDVITDKIEQYHTPAYVATLDNGKIYGIPLHEDPYVMLYNKDFVDQSEKEQIETLRALQEVQKTRILGKYNFAMPLGSSEQTVSLFYEFIYSSGGIMANVTSDNTTVIYEWFDEMKNTGMYPKEMINWTSDDLIEAFAKEMVNICFVKSSSVSMVNEYDLDFEYRVGEIPYSNRGIALYHGMSVGISQKAEAKTALDFASYLTSDDVMESYLEGSSVFSPKLGVYVNSLEEEGLPKEFIEYFNTKSTRAPTNSMWFSTREIIRMNLVKYMTEREIDVEDLKRNMEEDLKIIILEAD